jgi:dihydrodipicolinate synthase/N-acetylneuraminate lyase
VAAVIPVFGFYLQPAVGGRVLPYAFWRSFVEIENVVAIKMAPFNRYQTLDVVRAVAESGREDISLYTGNDDSIVVDLLTRFQFGDREVRVVGGLLGHWAAWTRCAVELLENIREGVEPKQGWLTLAAQVTDSNAALFDAANHFHGCIAGIHEILRRQGLLGGRWCLDPNEDLSPGQIEEIDRVSRAYPHLTDDTFVRDHLDNWLR